MSTTLEAVQVSPRVTMGDLVSRVSEKSHRAEALVKRVLVAYQGEVLKDAYDGRTVPFLGLLWLGPCEGGIKNLCPLSESVDKTMEVLKKQGAKDTRADVTTVLSLTQTYIEAYTTSGSKVLIKNLGAFEPDGKFARSSNLKFIKVRAAEGNGFRL